MYRGIPCTTLSSPHECLDLMHFAEQRPGMFVTKPDGLLQRAPSESPVAAATLCNTQRTPYGRSRIGKFGRFTKHDPGSRPITGRGQSRTTTGGRDSRRRGNFCNLQATLPNLNEATDQWLVIDRSRGG